MAAPTFKKLEHAGWSQRTEAYDLWFSHITSQVNEPLLNALGRHLGGARLLDVCTGTGYLAAAATKRVALEEGLDFAREVIERARANILPSRSAKRTRSSFRTTTNHWIILYARSAICIFRMLSRPLQRRFACSSPADDMLSRSGAHIPTDIFRSSLTRLGDTGRPMSDCRRRHRSSGLATLRKPSASCEARALLTCRRISLTCSGSRSAQMTWWSGSTNAACGRRCCSSAKPRMRATRYTQP